MIIQSRLGQELLQMNGWSVAGGPVQHRCEIGTERAALENFRVRMKKKKALKGFIGGGLTTELCRAINIYVGNGECL